MTTYVALLRAVNVGGRNRVTMRDLLVMLDALGFRGGRSLLQSGNLVFHADAQPRAELERLLEEETAARLSLRVDYVVRDEDEIEAVIAGNTFSDEAARDPGHLIVQFLKEAPAAGRVEALREAIAGRERVHVEGAQAYIVHPDGIGRSKLTGDLIERTLGTRGTGRNWNTVLKLAAMVRD